VRDFNWGEPADKVRPWNGSPGDLPRWIGAEGSLTARQLQRRIDALEGALRDLTSYIVSCRDPACKCPICLARAVLNQRGFPPQNEDR
jgi:hypothetical protein